MMLYAALLGVKVMHHWDFQSSSAYQLSLERKTYLISTLMNYVLGFQIISALLFIYTVEDIHKLFVGAMCATGSLNANPVGWTALMSKITVCFAAGFWLVLNYLDQKAIDYPFVRLKYSLLLILLPIIIFDSILQFRYFWGLDPDIITSCCGSLFSSSGTSVASSIAGLPVLPSMLLFFSGGILIIIISFTCLISQKSFLRALLFFCNGTFLVIALASIVSFISMYIYELPTHHCPFDILQREYGFIGYPLYLSLFGAVFFGLLPGIFHGTGKVPSLHKNYITLERYWIVFSLSSMIVFLSISTYRIIFSNLTYFAH